MPDNTPDWADTNNLAPEADRDETVIDEDLKHFSLASWWLNLASSTRAVVAIAFGTLLISGGCAATSPDRDGGTIRPLEEEDSAATRTDAHAPKLPRGMRWVVGSQTGLRFAVPRSWTVIPSAEFDGPANAEQLSDYADSLGIPVEVVKQSIRANDVVMADAHGNSVSVAQVPLASLPSDEDIQTMTEAIGAIDVSALEPVDTRVAPGGQVLVELPGNSFASTLFLELDSGIAAVTATTGSESRSRKLMKLVRRTLSLKD